MVQPLFVCVYYPSFEKEAEPLLNEFGCLHFKFSILLGISRPVYSNEQLEQMKAEDKQTFEFEGKEYTRYEASQLQRKIETAVRHEKDLANMAKASGNDDLRREAQYKINLLTSKYAQLSKASGLPTKMERMQVGGFRRVKEKIPLTKTANGGIIKEKRIFFTKDDPMREIFGSAFDSNPEETQEIIDNLTAKGVKTIFRDGVMSYQPSPSTGKLGQLVIDRNASFSAFKHEERHALDDENSGWLGYRNFVDKEKAVRFEVDAYDVEIAIAKENGLPDMVERLEKLKEDRRMELLGE